MNKLPTMLFKRTSTGATQIWYQEISKDGISYRTVSGQIDGKKVESAWKTVEQKNVGKANETSLKEQCLLEVESNYKKKLAQGNYKTSMEEEALEKDNFFKPMLAKVYGEDYVYNLSDVLYSQPKLDGVRCIVTKNGMYSRLGKPIISAPHIHEALKLVFEENPDLILDGELYSDKLAEDFNQIISLARQQKPTEEDFENSRKSLEYWIYDVNQMKSPYEERTKFLTSLVNDEIKQDCIKLVETTKVESEEHLNYLYAKYMMTGFEGQMVRVSKNGYENKRSKQLLKRKEFVDEEFVITNLIEGEGNWAGYAKSLSFKLNDGSGRTSDAGIAGKQEFCKMLFENKEDYIDTLVTVKYQNLTPDGKPRFPIAIKFLKVKQREL